MHVLIISNHPDAVLTQVLLPLEGFSASVVRSVDEAVGELGHYDTDVIVYDCRLRDAAPESVRSRLRVGRNPPPVLAIVQPDSISQNDAQARMSLLAHDVADAVLVRGRGTDFHPSREDSSQFFAHLRRMALARANLKLPDETFGRFRIAFAERRCFVLEGSAWSEITLPQDGYDLLEYLIFYRDEFVKINDVLDRLNAQERLVSRAPAADGTAAPGAAKSVTVPVVFDENALSQLVRRTREQGLTPVGLKWALESPPGGVLRFSTVNCAVDSRNDTAPSALRRTG